MAFQDLKFSGSDFVNQDISSLPDKVTGQAAFLKARFDNVGKNMIALDRFNQLIDLLAAMEDKLTNPPYASIRLAAPYTEPASTNYSNYLKFPSSGNIVISNPDVFSYSPSTGYVSVNEAGLYLVAGGVELTTAAGGWYGGLSHGGVYLTRFIDPSDTSSKAGSGSVIVNLNAPSDFAIRLYNVNTATTYAVSNTYLNVTKLSL